MIHTHLFNKLFHKADNLSTYKAGLLGKNKKLRTTTKKKGKSF